MATQSFHTVGTVAPAATLATTTPPAAPAPLPTAPLPDLLCPGDRPLTLLPVRLETRFFALPDGAQELRIRVYPDKIHLDAHEPALTRSEQQWAQHYWQRDWRAGNDAVARQRAWQQLAERFGSERASWLVRRSAPTNPQQRPTEAVADSDALAPAPQFPEVDGVQHNDDAWRSAPCARLLPVRWNAVLQSAGRPLLVARGKDIVQPLAVGPDPAQAVRDDDAELLDAGMRWMVDFDAAEAAGMGLRMVLPPAMLALPLDLVVLGVAGSDDAAAAATQWAELLDAQHHTDGLGVLPLGTPTNNSADRRAGYDSADPGHVRSFQVEIEAGGVAPEAASNAARLGSAFGMPAARVAPTLACIEGARLAHDADQRAMNTALWPVGWGYFLANVIGFDGTGLTPAQRERARDHFVAHVRAAGPLPVLRCARQPYGVLPVSSLDLWQGDTTDDDDTQAFARTLRELLLGLREQVWRPRVGEVARLGKRTPPDAQADLADVMRSEAQTGSWCARSVFGPHYLQHLRAFIGEDLQASGLLNALDAIAAALPQRLGLAWRARLARAVFAEQARPVVAAAVQAGDVSPWHRLEPDYIAALLAETRIDALLAPADGSLLHVLLRHALLRETAEAAARIAARLPGADLAALLRDAELVNLPAEAAATLTWKRQLDQVVPELTGTQTLRQFIEGQTRFDSAELRALGELRGALAHLQRLDSETLQHLMQGTLDLGAHRLDAWITSLATQRLQAMRRAAPEGLYVGGYGWVEQLRPAPPARAIEAPPGEHVPLFAHANDSGFIHAPSLTHAAAAALLRNAQLGANGQASAAGPFAIDLSSRRAREAERLLAGVRAGQPLGALLGYRVERSLHERQLDRFIAPLRELAPLVARKLEQTPLAVEAIAAHNVVDALVLQRRWADEAPLVRAALAAAGAGAAEMSALQAELDALADAIDGLGDALSAETAYQMARGNTGRLAGTLAAISQGDAPAPELEVLRMPRSGTAITHRVLALWSLGAGKKPTTTPGWAAASKSPRATAEPMLNAWAAGVLGDPRKVRCTVASDAAGAPVQTFAFAELVALGLAPLDVVYGIDAQSGHGAGSAGDIEQRVLEHARQRAGTEAANWRLVHERPADLGAGESCLHDLLEQARALRSLLAGARGAEPADLSPPHAGDSGRIDDAELLRRVLKAEKALASAHARLRAQLKAGERATPAALRKATQALAGFGIGPSVPSDAGAEALRVQAGAQLQQAEQRLAQSAGLRAQAEATEPHALCAQRVERMRAVFGRDFVMLPRFHCNEGARSEFGAALAASEQVQGGDTLAVYGWFQRAARVRDALARLSGCLRGAEVLGLRERLRLQVAQLPHAPHGAQPWVGLPPPSGQRVSEGKLSLVLQAGAIDVHGSLAGLWVDEWTEVVPHAEETTALAFQFNPPDACAPQNLLLAVPPVPGQAWTLGTLHRVLVETLDLAKLRGVEASSLGAAAQYLPALMLAFNAKDDAVSTDFAPLTR